MTPLLALALATARPLPDARDLREGQRATQCILLYRLQKPDVPTDSFVCEDAGYGLEFMRERDGEIRSIEQRHAEALAHARAEAKERQQARAMRSQLEVPCRELALGTGPGPDGGAHLCALAGLSGTTIAAELGREQQRARAEEELRDRRVSKVLGLALMGVVLAGLIARRAKRSHT